MRKKTGLLEIYIPDYQIFKIEAIDLQSVWYSVEKKSITIIQTERMTGRVFFFWPTLPLAQFTHKKRLTGILKLVEAAQNPKSVQTTKKNDEDDS